jgi:hypothetical protein
MELHFFSIILLFYTYILPTSAPFNGALLATFDACCWWAQNTVALVTLILNFLSRIKGKELEV